MPGIASAEAAGACAGRRGQRLPGTCQGIGATDAGRATGVGDGEHTANMTDLHFWEPGLAVSARYGDVRTPLSCKFHQKLVEYA